IYLDPVDIKELVGSDLGGHYIVVAAKVEPKYTKDILLDRDDFELRTAKDGEKAHPWSASQVAGSGGLVLRETRPEGIASPGWSGIGGAEDGGGGGGGGGKKHGRDGRNGGEAREGRQTEPAQEDAQREDSAGGQDHSAGQRTAVFPDGKTEAEGSVVALWRQGKPNHAPVQVKHTCAFW